MKTDTSKLSAAQRRELLDRLRGQLGTRAFAKALQTQGPDALVERALRQVARARPHLRRRLRYWHILVGLFVALPALVLSGLWLGQGVGRWLRWLLESV